MHVGAKNVLMWQAMVNLELRAMRLHEYILAEYAEGLGTLPYDRHVPI